MDEARLEIQAPAEQVYDLIADITNMGRWSPETYRTAWVAGATSAVPGARFKGWNHAKVWGLPARWTTTSTIRQADPGRAFSFDTPFSGARWTYRFTPTGDGRSCEVLETREEVASPPLVRAMYLVVGAVRRQQLAAGMEVTLRRLKDAAETAAAEAEA